MDFDGLCNVDVEVVVGWFEYFKVVIVYFVLLIMLFEKCLVGENVVQFFNIYWIVVFCGDIYGFFLSNKMF